MNPRKPRGRPRTIRPCPVALQFVVIVGAAQRHLVAAASRAPEREAPLISVPRLCIDHMHIIARLTRGHACVVPNVARGGAPGTAGALAELLRSAVTRLVGVLRVFAKTAARVLADVTVSDLDALAATRKRSLWRECVRVGARVEHKVPRSGAKSRGGGGKGDAEACFHLASKHRGLEGDSEQDEVVVVLLRTAFCCRGHVTQKNEEIWAQIFQCACKARVHL